MKVNVNLERQRRGKLVEETSKSIKPSESKQSEKVPRKKSKIVANIIPKNKT